MEEGNLISYSDLRMFTLRYGQLQSKFMEHTNMHAHTYHYTLNYYSEKRYLPKNVIGNFHVSYFYTSNIFIKLKMTVLSLVFLYVYSLLKYIP